jgi:hypothetical protein
MASPYQKPFRIAFWWWGWLITVLSLLPGKTMPALELWDWLALDKIGHFTVYACWMLLFQLAWRSNPAAGALGLALTGCLLEWLQGMFYQDRFFEISDIVANSAGILLGWMAFNHLFKQP